jgi:hypothetical protein
MPKNNAGFGITFRYGLRYGQTSDDFRRCHLRPRKSAAAKPGKAAVAADL